MAKQYENLIAQLNRLHRHNRQGSYRTRARYYEAMQRFCRFLANRYGLERLANIAPKHLIAYILYLQESGKAPSTIKTDLAAIRFYHDIMSAPRYTGQRGAVPPAAHDSGSRPHLERSGV